MLGVSILSMIVLGEGLWALGAIFAGVPLSVIAARSSFCATIGQFDDKRTPKPES
jgi:hypothetical protein